METELDYTFDEIISKLIDQILFLKDEIQDLKQKYKTLSQNIDTSLNKFNSSSKTLTEKIKKIENSNHETVLKNLMKLNKFDTETNEEF